MVDARGKDAPGRRGNSRSRSRGRENGVNGNGYGPPDGSGSVPHAPGLYRLDSDMSSTSIFEDVEMAHDELYSGPMAESLPTSVNAFAHRRSRADSTTSFAYYPDSPEGQDQDFFDDVRVEDLDDEPFAIEIDDEDEDEDLHGGREAGGVLLPDTGEADGYGSRSDDEQG